MAEPPKNGIRKVVFLTEVDFNESKENETKSYIITGAWNKNMYGLEYWFYYLRLLHLYIFQVPSLEFLKAIMNVNKDFGLLWFKKKSI